MTQVQEHHIRTAGNCCGKAMRSTYGRQAFGKDGASARVHSGHSDSEGVSSIVEATECLIAVTPW